MRVRRIANVSYLLFWLTVSPARAGQSAQAGDQQSLAAIRAACAEDAQKLCAGVQPGGGRIVACLREHKDSLSDRCKQAAGLTTNPKTGSAPSAPITSPTSESQAAGAATTPPAKPSPAAKTGTKAPSQTGAAPTSYLRLKQVQVIAHVADAAIGGKVDLPAIDLLIPSTWDFKGSVAGNTNEGCFSDLYAVSWEATSGDASVAFQGAPNDSWQYTDDPAALRKLTDPNRRALGLQGKPCPVKKPMKAEEYFRQNVFSAFPSGSTVVSVEPFPELDQMARKQLGLPADDAGNGGSTRTEAIRARVEFQKDGKTLEDWVSLVVVTRIFPQGRSAFYDCHAIDVMALRAPKGQLDANDKLFKVMISSVRPGPKWQAYSNGVIAKLYQAEAQKEATMDAMVAAFQKHVADTIMGVTANAQRGSQNSAFGFDQNVRGVQTFRDPTTGNTMELSNQFDHAWLNGSNEYIMSDDPNFNPNGQLSGNWNQLQPVKPAP
jgi:Cysteine rich repeat